MRSPSRSSCALRARFTLAALLLSSGALAALPTGAPTISSPQPVDAIDYEGSPQPQSAPAVAFDGTNYSVTWTGPVWPYGPKSARIGHVSPAGKVLDGEAPVVTYPTSIPSGTPFAQVVVGSTRFVFWETSSTDTNPTDVTMARVDASGNVLGVSSVAKGTQLSGFSVAASTDHIIVTYADDVADHVGVVVLDADGNVVSTNATFLPYEQVALAVSSQGFLVATQTTATRYAFDTTVVGSTTLPTTTAYPMAAATGASDYLLLFVNASDSAITGLRVGLTGALEDATPIAIGAGTDPAAAWSGAAWELSWISQQLNGTIPEPYQIMATQLATSGVVATPAALATLNYADATPVTTVTAGPSGQTLVAWCGSTADVLGVRMDATGTALDTTPIILSTVARAELSPAVAHGQGGYLAVWTSADRGVLAARFDESGAPLDATPILVTSTIAAPGVVASGDEYFVSWGSRIDQTYFGARVGADGNLRDAAPLSLPGFVVAGGGGRFLTLEQLEPSDVLRGALLDASGAQVVAPFPFEPATAHASGNSFAAAWNGTSFDVVWSALVVNTALGTNEVHTALVATDGSITALAPLATGLPVQGQIVDVLVQAVATSSSQTLVSWYESQANQGLQLVDATGKLIGGSLSLAGTVDQYATFVSDADGRALAVWETPLPYGSGQEALNPLQAVSIDLTTSPATVGTPFTIAAPSDAFSAAVASGGSSGLTFVATSSAPSDSHMPRVAAQSVLVPLAAACGDDGGACPNDGGTNGDDGGAPDAGGPPVGGNANDGGAPADAGRGANGAASSSSGCGCSTAPSEGGEGSLAGALLVAAVLAARKRRSGPQQHARPHPGDGACAL